MSNDYSDLLAILAEVTRSVADNRFIWCLPADGYETTVTHRRSVGGKNKDDQHDRLHFLVEAIQDDPLKRYA